MSEDFWRGYLTASIISLLMLFLANSCAARADVRTIITAEAQRQNFDVATALAIAKIESNFNPRAIGPKKEIGLFQLLPKFISVAPKELLNPHINARIGIARLKEAQIKCALKEEFTFVICYNNGWRKPKYPYKHPYYKKFLLARKEINE